MTAGETPSFVDDVLDVVDSIPAGRVLSYGDVAALLGTRAARAVGSVMRRYGHAHPWWRVVRSGGLPPAGHEASAREHYELEGTPLRAISREPGYAVDYAEAMWRPLHPAGTLHERIDHSR
ncbi:MGMT family protein [Herbiconiux moechotypicola]|uniref:Methylated-DNA-[protein]-cysteine S-methyltransferase DNA binding domain-containing protein n=1 Tax=Herbiconiux moechotypicola TaxID=637393 RepID=A0ABN3DSC5_9MICO|nr:MGMT family protein [Herbiconiux moechotypicola]MCS5730632.1 MGMT family protein [Herbiconiux moechotypicola]